MSGLRVVDAATLTAEYDRLAELANEVMLATLAVNPIPLRQVGPLPWAAQERFIAAVEALGTYLANHTQYDGRATAGTT